MVAVAAFCFMMLPSAACCCLLLLPAACCCLLLLPAPCCSLADPVCKLVSVAAFSFRLLLAAAAAAGCYCPVVSDRASRGLDHEGVLAASLLLIALGCTWTAYASSCLLWAPFWRSKGASWLHFDSTLGAFGDPFGDFFEVWRLLGSHAPFLIDLGSSWEHFGCHLGSILGAIWAL